MSRETAFQTVKIQCADAGSLSEVSSIISNDLLLFLEKIILYTRACVHAQAIRIVCISRFNYTYKCITCILYGINFKHVYDNYIQSCVTMRTNFNTRYVLLT